MEKEKFKKLLEIKEKKDLSDAQTLYLISIYHKINIYLAPEEFLELVDEEIINAEGELNVSLDPKSSKALTNKPIFESKLTKQIYMYIKSAIAFKNTETGLAISINPKHSPDRIARYNDRITSLVKSKKAFYSPYSVFLALFPTMLLEDNKKWVSFFKSKYDGMELRKKTVTNANRFIKHTKNVDMGVFMYGVYLFIRNGIKENQTFIGGQKTFFEEWQDWYDKAKIAIDNVKGDDYIKLFKNKNKYKGGVSL